MTFAEYLQHVLFFVWCFLWIKSEAREYNIIAMEKGRKEAIKYIVSSVSLLIGCMLIMVLLYFLHRYHIGAM
jgi:hypothetical protein